MEESIEKEGHGALSISFGASSSENLPRRESQLPFEQTRPPAPAALVNKQGVVPEEAPERTVLRLLDLR